MIKSVNHVLIYTFICFLCRSWSGVHRVSKGSVEAARFLLLGHPLFPHDPLPGPGQSGNMQHTQRMIPSPHCVCLQISLLTQSPPPPQFVCVESLATAITDLFPRQLRRPRARELLVLAIVVVCFLLGLPLITQVSLKMRRGNDVNKSSCVMDQLRFREE